MEVLKFNDNIVSTDRVFKRFDKELKKRDLEFYNSKGYKLYYYKDFKLIEIPKLINHNIKTVNSPWGKAWDIWGEMVFFLDDSEYDDAMKLINTSKELYDRHIESANKIAQLPMSHIYYNVLKQK